MSTITTDAKHHQTSKLIGSKLEKVAVLVCSESMTNIVPRPDNPALITCVILSHGDTVDCLHIEGAAHFVQGGALGLEVTLLGVAQTMDAEFSARVKDTNKHQAHATKAQRFARRRI